MREKQPINELMKQAAEMSANGVSYGEIAERLGRNKSNVQRWFTRDDMRDLRRKIIEQKMGQAVGKALAVLERQLEDNNGWLAQNAAREIIRLDTENRKAIATQAGMSVVFNNMPIPGAPKSAELPDGKAAGQPGDDEYEDTIEGEFADEDEDDENE